MNKKETFRKKRIGNVVFDSDGGAYDMKASLVESVLDDYVGIDINADGSLRLGGLGQTRNTWSEASDAIEEHLLKKDKTVREFRALPDAE